MAVGAASSAGFPSPTRSSPGMRRIKAVGAPDLHGRHRLGSTRKLGRDQRPRHGEQTNKWILTTDVGAPSHSNSRRLERQPCFDWSCGESTNSRAAFGHRRCLWPVLPHCDARVAGQTLEPGTSLRFISRSTSSSVTSRAQAGRDARKAAALRLISFIGARRARHAGAGDRFHPQ